MRFTFMALALAGIAGASIAEARGLEYGPRVALSLPTQDAGKSLERAAGYGLTATILDGPSSGFGLDIGYYRWPGAVEMDRSLDRLFSALTGASISGSKTTVSAFQAGMHMKLFAPETRRLSPWVKLGVAAHRVNTRLQLPIAQLQAAGAQLNSWKADNVSHQLGGELGVGFEMRITPHTALGLDGSYLLITMPDPPVLSSFTIGMSLLDR